MSRMGMKAGLRSQFSVLRSQVSGLRSQVSGLRSQVSGLRSQLWHLDAAMPHFYTGYLFIQRFCLADLDMNANALRYSLMGRAGVPQKTMPLPRITFLVGMPLWAPRMAPASMRT